ncbi:Hypothetical predicted protein [Paramuricea clavata]|uniref:Uncharacterized protein n=1 Tax=Paramuricea clavata TaxID=317549 RepID=A0A7D9E120_PARCT|nr:Hypothetical predicted protein [Paramuricea clavata]
MSDINESYEEILKRMGCDMIFKPGDSMLEDATFYFDFARAMASSLKKHYPWKAMNEWRNRNGGMKEWQSGVWVDNCESFNYLHYCDNVTLELKDEQKLKDDREKKRRMRRAILTFVQAVVENIQNQTILVLLYKDTYFFK